MTKPKFFEYYYEHEFEAKYAEVRNGIRTTPHDSGQRNAEGKPINPLFVFTLESVGKIFPHIDKGPVLTYVLPTDEAGEIIARCKGTMPVTDIYESEDDFDGMIFEFASDVVNYHEVSMLPEDAASVGGIETRILEQLGYPAQVNGQWFIEPKRRELVTDTA